MPRERRVSMTRAVTPAAVKNRYPAWALQARMNLFLSSKLGVDRQGLPAPQPLRLPPPQGSGLAARSTRRRTANPEREAERCR